MWDSRYRYVDEFRRMGAHIQVDGKVAVIEGVPGLTGAPVHACDLRAGAAMVIAGLAAQGITEVDGIYHIERGYEDLVGKLAGVGAEIQVVTVPDEESQSQAVRSHVIHYPNNQKLGSPGRRLTPPAIPSF